MDWLAEASCTDRTDALNDTTGVQGGGSAVRPGRPRDQVQPDRKSCDESSLAECLEDDLLERSFGVRPQVADVVPSTKLFELGGVRVPGLDVGGRELRRDVDFTPLAGLGVDELHLAEPARVAVAH